MFCMVSDAILQYGESQIFLQYRQHRKFETLWSLVGEDVRKKYEDNTLIHWYDFLVCGF